MAYECSEINRTFALETLNSLVEIQMRYNSLKLGDKSHAEKKAISRIFRGIKRNAAFLNFSTLELLSQGMIGVLTSLIDEKIVVSDRLDNLIRIICKKIKQSCTCIIKGRTDQMPDVLTYLVYCNRIAAGEIVTIDEAEDAPASEAQADVEQKEEALCLPQMDFIQIKPEKLNDIVSVYEELIVREQSIKQNIVKLRSIEEKYGDSELRRLCKSLAENSESLEKIIIASQAQLLKLRMVPLQILFDKLNKEFSSCVFPETEIRLEYEILEKLMSILRNLIENALKYGSATTVRFECTQNASGMELCVADNGNGIDWEVLRQHAAANFREEAKRIAKMSKQELSTYLFRPNFIGRGKTGLDSVWSKTEEIKGHIRIDCDYTGGTRFLLSLPYSIALEQGFFILSNDKKYFIPSHHIIDVISKNKSEFISLQNQNFVKFNERLIPVYSLSSLFYQAKKKNPNDLKTILIAEYMEQKIGIIVGQVLSYVPAIVKKMPPAFKDFKILQGAVLDENFDLVPVLYTPYLMARLRALRGFDVKKFDAKMKKKQLRILIVDDSDTVRQIQRVVLTGNGFLVDEAKDGIFALEKLKKFHFDLIVCDTEMPRMNGLIFLENLRRMESYSTTPVVVFDSSLEEEQLAEYKNAGANAFVEKKNFNRKNLIKVIKELLNV